MKTALLSALLGTQLAIPVADRVPTFNVAASCRAAADINKSIGLADSQSYDSCMSDENSARQQLVPIWASFPAADRDRCEGESSSAGIDSYVELLVCLQMARDASALNVTPLKGARKRK